MKTIKLNLPKSWDELSEKQLCKMVVLFHSVKPSAKFDLKVLFILLNFKWWQFRQKAKIRIVLWDVPMSEIKKDYEFIYKENNRTIFPNVIKLKNRKLYFPPQNKLANLTADEFSIADDLHIKWHETKNIEYLQYLAAVLYTQNKSRNIFDKNDLHENVKQFLKVSPDKLLAIELAYFGCKNAIIKRFPKVFPKTLLGAPKPKKKYGFGKVILSMAKGDLSKLESIKRVNIYAFLEQFEEDLINASNKKS